MSITVFLYNKELHDHGEPDDVDPDDDFRFDIIYRYLDPLTRQVEDGVDINLGIEKGNIQDGRDEIKNIVSWGTFPLTPVEIVVLVYICIMHIICVPAILSIVMKTIQKILNINNFYFLTNFSLFPFNVCIYERDLQRRRH